MSGDRRAPATYDEYTVAVICAMSFEMSAARYMLDVEHPPLPTQPGDSNLYVLGKLSGHFVVLASLPGTQGKGAAATVATNLARTFPSIQCRFLVGIGGGVPSDRHDIRLGDVVVSMPDGPYGGVVQYDLGKELDDSFALKGFLLPLPTLMRSAVEMMRSDHLLAKPRIDEFVLALVRRGPRFSTHQRPSTELDVLFKSDYLHVCSSSDCRACDPMQAVKRPPRKVSGSEIHYELIASGDRVMRNAISRHTTVGNIGDILCFEMEAAGLMTEYPCLVIRGISDYADSHKNDCWHHHAAAVAAACAKELLSYLKIPPLSSAQAPAAAVPNATTSTFQGRGVQHSGSGNFSVGGDLNIGNA